MDSHKSGVKCAENEDKCLAWYEFPVICVTFESLGIHYMHSAYVYESVYTPILLTLCRKTVT